MWTGGHWRKGLNHRGSQAHGSTYSILLWEEEWLIWLIHTKQFYNPLYHVYQDRATVLNQKVSVYFFLHSFLVWTSMLSIIAHFSVFSMGSAHGNPHLPRAEQKVFSLHLLSLYLLENTQLVQKPKNYREESQVLSILMFASYLAPLFSAPYPFPHLYPESEPLA